MSRFKNWIIAGIIVIISSVGLSFDDDDRDFKLAKSLDVFYTLYREVSTFYVNDIDHDELIETGINAMLKKLDPYTVYIPESDLDGLKFMTTGQYGGIGALIRKSEGRMLIYEPYEGSPAAKSGLCAGDEIIEIDGVSGLGEKGIDAISDLLKGQPNTSLKLKVKRPYEDEIIEKEIMRDKIIIPNVPYYSVMSNNIGYIRLSGFTSGAAKEVKAAFEKLKEGGVKSLILDLRSNPGGILQEAVDIVNLFIAKGVPIVETKGKTGKWNKSYSTLNEPVDLDIPLSVLVNSGSASASEIVAGAIQDLDRGVVIGQKTFGKGLVQSTRQLAYNSMLKVTTAKYYIPSGRCVQALDYAHKNEDGSVGSLPDSLKKSFMTHNGREVFDGGGVEPDIVIDAKELGKITIDLIVSEKVFEFATKYHSEHKTIANARDFSISTKDYEDFKTYLQEVKFVYKTDTEKALEDVEKIAKNEKYYERVKVEIDNLKTSIHKSQNDDITLYKSEITKLLNSEIVSRYYHQKGKIENSISSNDLVIEKAKGLLDKQVEYNTILAINK